MVGKGSILSLFLLVAPAIASQEPKREQTAKPVLTEEEKDILKNREILEHLDLLQDFEKFRYFDYFAANEKAAQAQEPKKPATKKEAKKEEKKKK
jgi:hypothetical protein